MVMVSSAPRREGWGLGFLVLENGKATVHILYRHHRHLGQIGTSSLPGILSRLQGFPAPAGSPACCRLPRRIRKPMTLTAPSWAYPPLSRFPGSPAFPPPYCRRVLARVQHVHHGSRSQPAVMVRPHSLLYFRPVGGVIAPQGSCPAVPTPRVPLAPLLERLCRELMAIEVIHRASR